MTKLEPVSTQGNEENLSTSADLWPQKQTFNFGEGYANYEVYVRTTLREGQFLSDLKVSGRDPSTFKGFSPGDLLAIAEIIKTAAIFLKTADSRLDAARREEADDEIPFFG